MHYLFRHLMNNKIVVPRKLWVRQEMLSPSHRSLPYPQHWVRKGYLAKGKLAGFPESHPWLWCLLSAAFPASHTGSGPGEGHAVGFVPGSLVPMAIGGGDSACWDVILVRGGQQWRGLPGCSFIPHKVG